MKVNSICGKKYKISVLYFSIEMDLDQIVRWAVLLHETIYEFFEFYILDINTNADINANADISNNYCDVDSKATYIGYTEELFSNDNLYI